MATHRNIVLLTCLLLLVAVMEEVKPTLAERQQKLKQRTKILEETVKELNKKMKEQEEKIKVLEECKGKYTHHQSIHKMSYTPMVWTRVEL